MAWRQLAAARPLVQYALSRPAEPVAPPSALASRPTRVMALVGRIVEAAA